MNDVQPPLHLRARRGRRRLTVAGDHRPAIFGWRGGRVELVGALHDDLQTAPDGEGVELQENFRSTPRVIDLANRCATTITPPGGMGTPDVTHGRDKRYDYDETHVGFVSSDERDAEADWIADTVAEMVQREPPP